MRGDPCGTLRGMLLCVAMARWDGTGYGLAGTATLIPAGPDPLNRWITTYFRKEFTLGAIPSKYVAQ